MTKDELLVVMRVLSRYGFIDFDGSTECYSLREPLLVDYLYTSIPFRQRTALHSFAAEWLLEYTHDNLTNAAVLYPLIIHHFNMAFQESRSAAIMQCVKVRHPAYNATSTARQSPHPASTATGRRREPAMYRFLTPLLPA